MAWNLDSIRRYPVKSMGGESLDAVDLDARGVVGDRWYAVEDEDGRFASGKSTRRFRRRDGVFDFRATMLGSDVEVSGPGGTFAVGPALDDAVGRHLGVPVRVTAEGGVPHQDGGSVSIVGTATLRFCEEEWGIDADPRRLRVNLVVGTDEPFVEESWVGQEIALGGAVLRVVQRVPRCRTVDIDQDGATGGGGWLKRLATERDSNLAVYADVVQPGRIATGDALHLR